MLAAALDKGGEVVLFFCLLMHLNQSWLQYGAFTMAIIRADKPFIPITITKTLGEACKANVSEIDYISQPLSAN